MPRTAAGKGLRVIAMAAVLSAVAASAQQPQQPFGKGAYRADEPGLVKPKLLKQVSPNYPTVARNASVAGDVVLEAVVQPDGKVGDIRLVRSLDKRFGLDQEAMRVAKLWLFEAARKDGFPVPVIVEIVVQFRLRADAGRSAPPRIGVPSGTFTASASQTVESVPVLSDEPDEEFVKGAHRLSDPGVVPPKVKTSVTPAYPASAGSARPTGIVELDVIVMADGTIGKMRVAKSMDKPVGITGFDAAAIAAVKQWRFEPGTKDGVAAPVVMRLQIEFRNRF
jgi:TonB family protein